MKILFTFLIAISTLTNSNHFAPITDAYKMVREIVKPINKFYEYRENKEGTYAYEVYTDKEGPCDRGYLNSEAPIYCILRIISLKDQKVLVNLKSDKYGIFNYYNHDFNSPKDWYSENTLLFQDGMGDAGFSISSTQTLNIETNEFRQLYKEDHEDGKAFYAVGKKRVLFNFLFEPPQVPSEQGKEWLEVYEVPETINSFYEIEDHNTAEVDLSKFKKINSLTRGNYSEYEIGKGIIIYTEDDQKFIYDIEKNIFTKVKK